VPRRRRARGVLREKKRTLFLRTRAMTLRGNANAPAAAPRFVCASRAPFAPRSRALGCRARESAKARCAQTHTARLRVRARRAARV
jgi:hypothetical protein